MNERQQPLLTLHKLVKRFPGVTAVNAVSFEIYPGELVAILGPSGCGKSTLLQLIAGLSRPESGTISYAGEDWVNRESFVPPENRDCGMVFQDMALFPHLSVGRNVGFAISWPRKRATVKKMLELVGLKGLAKRMIHELSGGQQQRVALARSLAPEPDLLLLDEPFSSLDFKLRQEMRREVRHILKQQEVTSILVTHDQNEAFAFADTVAVMFNGQVEQHGSPQQIYRQPATRATAAFVGEANFIIMEQALYWFPILEELDDRLHDPENIFMCRPEDLLLEANEEAPAATVTNTEFQGGWQELQLTFNDDSITLNAHSRKFFKKGQGLDATPRQGCIYSPEGELIGLFPERS